MEDQYVPYDPYRVRRLVKSSGLTPKEIALLSSDEISWSWVYGLMRGSYVRADRRKLLVLSRILGADPSSLIISR